MLKTKATTIEFVGDAEIVEKKKGGVLLKGFVKDTAKPGERATFIPLVIFDEELVERVRDGAVKGARMKVEAAEVTSRRYETANGKRSAYELVVTKGKLVD